MAKAEDTDQREHGHELEPAHRAILGVIGVHLGLWRVRGMSDTRRRRRRLDRGRGADDTEGELAADGVAVRARRLPAHRVIARRKRIVERCEDEIAGVRAYPARERSARWS